MYLKLFVLVSMFQNYQVTQIVQTENEQDSSKKVNLPNCGLSKRLDKISLRIVGGKKADISEFPWAVTFQKKMSERSAPLHFCGGSVINNRWLLSASHCFQGVKHSIKRVRAVVGSTKWNDSNAVFYEIDKLVMHEKFNSFNYGNDIALIKTKTPIKFRSDANTFHINSICLSSPSDPMPQNGTIYGWGLLGEESTRSEDLMTTTLQKANMTMCNQAYKQYIGKFTPQMICYSARGKDACQGDSGGPLSHFTKGYIFVPHLKAISNSIINIRKEYQSGIVSFGLGCARTENPGIYTIVGMYLEWIKKTINDN